MRSKSLDSDLQLRPADCFACGEGLKPGALRVKSRELLRSAFDLGRGEWRPTKPVAFVRAEGDTAYDLLGTTYATIKLVSDRFVSVLREHGFSGWITFPSAVFLDDGSELKHYQVFAVTGRCGAIEDQLSEQSCCRRQCPTGEPVLACAGFASHQRAGTAATSSPQRIAPRSS